MFILFYSYSCKYQAGNLDLNQQRQIANKINKIVNQREGCYKDIFINGGVALFGMSRFYAADELGLSYEYFFAHENVKAQNNLYLGNEIDNNGIFLYPDGEPRFRLIYIPGGSSAKVHGASLGAKGKKIIQTFYNNGGSYCGSCAGAYLVSLGHIDNRIEEYFQIWPGYVVKGGFIHDVNHIVPENSIIKSYSEYNYFNGYIENIYHHNGCFPDESTALPQGTEILTIIDFPVALLNNENDENLNKAAKEFQNKIASWAYKKDKNSGRLVVTHGHPEYHNYGKGLELMKTFLLYALDGSGEPDIKAILKNGILRKMDNNNDALFSKIGDKQYHHFVIELDDDYKKLTVELQGEDGNDFNLYANKDDFAFQSKAEYKNINNGSVKSIKIKNPKKGKWFIAVECATTVDVINNYDVFEYKGNLKVLNGVSYQIKAEYE